MTPAELAARLPPRLGRWAPQLLAAQLCYGVDPFLMAAVLDRESLGGEALTPPTPAGTGDRGHGLGLVQIDDRYHKGFALASDDTHRLLWQDPTFNVLYGARLLARNLASSDGDEAMALAAYNAGLQRAFRVTRGIDDPVRRLEQLDSITTGRNYVSDVFRRRADLTNPQESR